MGSAAAHGGRNSVQVEVDGGVFTVANLKIDSKEQKQLDLYFEEGEKVVFYITGQDPVHLAGYYVPEDEGMDYGDFDSEDGLDDEELKNRLIASGEMSAEDFDDSEDDEVEVAKPKQVEASKPAEAANGNKKNKKEQKPAEQKNNAKSPAPKAAEQKTEQSPAPGGKRKGEANTPKAKKGKST